MTYIEEGITKVLYISSQGGVINLNNIISELKTNRMDFSSLSIEKVENTQELFARVKGLTDGLFAGDVYGGDQNNPGLYLDSFFESNGSMFRMGSRIKSYLNSLFKSNDSMFEMEMGSRISDMIETFFPELATMSYSEQRYAKMRLAELYADSGCAYMAFANMVTQYLSSIENGAQIYENAFGIPMQIRGKYTEEFLAISFCISGVSKETNGKLANLTANIIDELGWRGRYIKYITEYLAERGIKIETKHFDAGTTNARSNLLSTTVSNPGSFCIIRASEFDLELLSTSSRTGKNMDAATASSITVGRIMEKVGGHAMLITGVTEAGEIIVSSWSEKYRFIPESLIKYRDSRSGMWIVDVSLADSITVPTVGATTGFATSQLETSTNFADIVDEASSPATTTSATTIQTADSRISDMIRDISIIDQTSFDNEIESLLNGTNTISRENLLELADIYKTQTSKIAKSINLKLYARITDIIEVELNSNNINEVKKIVKNLSDKSRIEIINELMIYRRILTRNEFAALLPENAHSFISDNYEDIQMIMSMVFDQTGLTDIDKKNIINIITEICKRVNITQNSTDLQTFIQEMVKDYCKSPNYKSFVTNTHGSSISVFNINVFRKINNINFVEEIKASLPASTRAQVELDMRAMAENIENVLLNNVESGLEYDTTRRETKPNVALKNMPEGLVGLLIEGFNGIRLDNYAYYMFSAYPDNTGQKKLVVIQSSKGRQFGATNHWNEISLIGTGNSMYDGHPAVTSIIKQRILDASGLSSGVTLSTATTEDFKLAGDILFNKALAEFTKGNYVQIRGVSGVYSEGQTNQDYDRKNIYRCYVDASLDPPTSPTHTHIPFYIEILYADNVQLGRNGSAPQIFHMTPLSNEGLDISNPSIVVPHFTFRQHIIDINEGLIVKDAAGHKTTP